MKQRCHFVLLELVLLVASASGQPDAIATRFKQLDTDSDGKQSADEVKAASAALQRWPTRSPSTRDGLIDLSQMDSHCLAVSRCSILRSWSTFN
jgi:hypothetical protein